MAHELNKNLTPVIGNGKSNEANDSIIKYFVIMYFACLTSENFVLQVFMVFEFKQQQE